MSTVHDLLSLDTSPVSIFSNFEQLNLVVSIQIATISVVWWLLEKFGLVRDLNPGPLAPYARIIPLDQQADAWQLLKLSTHLKNEVFIKWSVRKKFNITPSNFLLKDLLLIFLHVQLKITTVDGIGYPVKVAGLSGIWTRDLSHPKRKSYP